MAIGIEASIVTSVQVRQIRVRLTSISEIVDPEAFIQDDADIRAEILARAGLPSTLIFVAVTLVQSGFIGEERFYDLITTYDRTPVSASGHEHDSTSLVHPLQEAYNDGPHIDLDPTLGPVSIKSLATAVGDLFEISETTEFLLRLTKDGNVRIGRHLRWEGDNQYDIGSPDGGTLLRRPRDLYLGRNLFMGGDLDAAGSGTFDTFLHSGYVSFEQQASNPSTSNSSRHLFWNAGDNTLRFWDGAIETVVGSGGGGGGGGITGTYSCPAAVAIGHVVTITGTNTVDRADAAILGTKPVIGICISKPDATTAIVQLVGEVSVFGASLIPNTTYFLSKTPGALTATLAGFVPGDVAQTVGISKNPSTLTLRFESRTVT